MPRFIASLLLVVLACLAGGAHAGEKRVADRNLRPLVHVNKGTIQLRDAKGRFLPSEKVPTFDAIMKDTKALVQKMEKENPAGLAEVRNIVRNATKDLDWLK